MFPAELPSSRAPPCAQATAAVNKLLQNEETTSTCSVRVKPNWSPRCQVDCNERGPLQPRTAERLQGNQNYRFRMQKMQTNCTSTGNGYRDDVSKRHRLMLNCTTASASGARNTVPNHCGQVLAAPGGGATSATSGCTLRYAGERPVLFQGNAQVVSLNASWQVQHSSHNKCSRSGRAQ